MKEKKKYTIIYSERELVGSHWITSVEVKYIKTSNMRKYLNSHNDLVSSLWFIFEGHHKHYSDY